VLHKIQLKKMPMHNYEQIIWGHFKNCSSLFSSSKVFFFDTLFFESLLLFWCNLLRKTNGKMFAFVVAVCLFVLLFLFIYFVFVFVCLFT